MALTLESALVVIGVTTWYPDRQTSHYVFGDALSACTWRIPESREVTYLLMIQQESLFLLPASKIEGRNVFTSVCHSVHRRGGVWYHFLSGPMFFIEGGMMSLPVWSHVPSRGYCPRGGMALEEGVWSQKGATVYPTPCYWHLVAAAKAGGTHPTGMHSSCHWFRQKILKANWCLQVSYRIVILCLAINLD